MTAHTLQVLSFLKIGQRLTSVRNDLSGRSLKLCDLPGSCSCHVQTTAEVRIQPWWIRSTLKARSLWMPLSQDGNFNSNLNGLLILNVFITKETVTDLGRSCAGTTALQARQLRESRIVPNTSVPSLNQKQHRRVYQQGMLRPIPAILGSRGRGTPWTSRRFI